MSTSTASASAASGFGCGGAGGVEAAFDLGGEVLSGFGVEQAAEVDVAVGEDAQVEVVGVGVGQVGAVGLQRVEQQSRAEPSCAAGEAFGEQHERRLDPGGGRGDHDGDAGGEHGGVGSALRQDGSGGGGVFGGAAGLLEQQPADAVLHDGGDQRCRRGRRGRVRGRCTAGWRCAARSGPSVRAASTVGRLARRRARVTWPSSPPGWRRSQVRALPAASSAYSSAASRSRTAVQRGGLEPFGAGQHGPEPLERDGAGQLDRGSVSSARPRCAVGSGQRRGLHRTFAHVFDVRPASGGRQASKSRVHSASVVDSDPCSTLDSGRAASARAGDHGKARRMTRRRRVRRSADAVSAAPGASDARRELPTRAPPVRLRGPVRLRASPHDLGATSSCSGRLRLAGRRHRPTRGSSRSRGSPRWRCSASQPGRLRRSRLGRPAAGCRPGSSCDRQRARRRRRVQLGLQAGGWPACDVRGAAGRPSPAGRYPPSQRRRVAVAAATSRRCDAGGRRERGRCCVPVPRARLRPPRRAGPGPRAVLRRT